MFPRLYARAWIVLATTPIVHLEGGWLLLYSLQSTTSSRVMRKEKRQGCVLTYHSPRCPPRQDPPFVLSTATADFVLPCLVDKGPRVRDRACLKLERSNKATHMKLRTLRSDAPPISPCRLPKALRIRFTSNGGGRKSEVVGCIWLVFCLFVCSEETSSAGRGSRERSSRERS